MKVLLTLTDVEPAVRLNAQLEKAELQTVLVSPLDDVPGTIAREKPDVIVLTGGLLDPTNVQLVRQQLWRNAAIVGLSDVSDPVLDERLRAVGYTEIYTKPVAIDEVASGIRRLIERRRLQRVTGLNGESSAIRGVLIQVEKMAPVSSTVLIEGESGTGKELVARAIHQLSPRRLKPFIAVNVGALPETLLESELFGHEKGSFTGATERRLGRFELADTGTLFLDEIGEIPLSTQVRLLRVLEEREITRVGGVEPIEVDVRVVAATNRPLREAVQAGTFRPDLYFRLNVLRIYLAPLRERRDDIPFLIRRFVEDLSARHDRPFHGISAEAMDALVKYSWPGNVRELRNLIESMVVLAPGHEIGISDIPREYREESARFLPVHVGPAIRGGQGLEGREIGFILQSLVELKLQVEELRRRMDQGREIRPGLVGEIPTIEERRLASSPLEAPDQAPPPNTVIVTPGMTMAEIERSAILAALRETRGNRRKAAELLDLGERTLYRKLKELGED